jgi:hypothetical protein
MKLPDLPRAPESDLSRMLCSIIERADMEALTRLPDFLRDVGREDDCQQVMATTWELFRAVSNLDKFSRSVLSDRWEKFVAPTLVNVFAWDLFDFASCLAIAGRKLNEAPTPRSGPAGKMTVGGREISISSWAMTTHGEQVDVEFGAPVTHAVHEGGILTRVTESGDTLTFTGDDSAHALELHPDFEYRRISHAGTPVPATDSPPWQPNVHRDEYTGIQGVHWMRPKQPPSSPT